MCNLFNSLVYSRSTSKAQLLELLSPYLSKLNFTGSNHLNLSAEGDCDIAKPYKYLLSKQVIYFVGSLGSQNVKCLLFTLIYFLEISETSPLIPFSKKQVHVNI